MAAFEVEGALKVMACLPIIQAGARSSNAWAGFDEAFAQKLSEAKIDGDKLADTAATVGTVRAFVAQAGASGIEHLHYG